MKSDTAFYREGLYPFQDGILGIAGKLRLPFYLTGGTALSRGYFNHRYSDDLDLFVNRNEGYSRLVAGLYAAIENAQETLGFRILAERTRKSEDFTQIFLASVERTGLTLKIDLVNDIAAHFGRITVNRVLGRIDSLRNILSNKLSALYRFEPKDIADLWTIARHKRFSWKQMILDGQRKEGGLDPIAVCDVLGSFPEEALATIRWVKGVPGREFKSDLDRMVADIARGRMNSLCGPGGSG